MRLHMCTVLAQARRVRLLSCSSPAVPPTHLYEGCQALRCEVETASGARLVVVLGGPTAVLGQQPLVEHALRQTLVRGCDAPCSSGLQQPAWLGLG